MAKTARQIRVADDLLSEIEKESEERGKSWSAMTTELLNEGIRMRRAPGIVFADGPSGRRAVVAGSGIDVWEVISTWRECGRELDALRRNYPWLTEPQLQAALAYYQAYPAEIEARLEREAQWTPDRVRRELSFAQSRNH